MVKALADHLGVATPVDAEVPEITRNVAPEAVLDEIEATARLKEDADAR
jgi:hypothetical protein